jgi:uncharacterized protein YdhG (YjbR/CyaY superfamily)
MTNIPVAITKTELIEKVNDLVASDSLSYTEAVVEICDELELEYEDVAQIIGPTLKNKLKCEAINMNVIKEKTGRLLFK